MHVSGMGLYKPHSMYVEVRGQSQAWFSPSISFEMGSLSYLALYTRLAGSQASADSLVSASSSPQEQQNCRWCCIKFFYLGSRSSRSGPHTRMASSLSTELPLALKRENSNEASFESRVSSQRPKQLRLSFSKSVFCRPSAKGEQRFPDFQTNQGRTEKALGKVNAFPPN